MEIDRAIEILNPDHREHYKNLEEVNEACRMGMEALERTRRIPCSERLPEAGKILVTDGETVTIFKRRVVLPLSGRKNKSTSKLRSGSYSYPLDAAPQTAEGGRA